MKEVEKAAIIEGIERNGAQATELVIQKVLRQRHAKVRCDVTVTSAVSVFES